MTATYTPDDALTVVRKYVQDAPITTIDSQLCDAVNSTIWMSYPWGWAQSALTAISLTDGTQDFSLDAGDTDIHRILRLRTVRTDTTPNQYRDLILRDWLPPDLSEGSFATIQSAAYDPVSAKIRLERAISISSGETVQIQGEYWREPTKITPATLYTAFDFPDRHFPTFCEGLKWKLKQYIHDADAGSIQTDRKGNQAYTGQLGIFMDSLFRMMQSEDYGDVGAEFPDSPFGERMSLGVGIYG